MNEQSDERFRKQSCDAAIGEWGAVVEAASIAADMQDYLELPISALLVSDQLDYGVGAAVCDRRPGAVGVSRSFVAHHLGVDGGLHDSCCQRCESH